MTDLEISKALALAIGWKDHQITVTRARWGGNTEWEDLCICVVADGQKYGRPFWYTDWNVIGPIAARYNKFPLKMTSGLWVTDLDQVGADTPQKAIALAVIQGAKS